MSKPLLKSAQTLEYLQLFRANSSRSVMIRDLPFSCANQDVSNLCYQMLGILPPLVHVIFDTKGCPLHYGYILFDTDDDARQAISKLDRLRFRGRDIRFVSFNSAGSHERGRQGAVHVYFRAQGSLSSPITEENLRKFLETYGELEHVIIRTYGYNAEGLVEGFGFATYLDANIHFRVCSEAKCLIFEGVSYRCTLSRKLSPNSSIASQVRTDVPSPSHISPPQPNLPQVAASSLPTSYVPIASSPDPEPRLSYDSNTSQPEFSHSLSPAIPPVGPFTRTHGAPISSGPFVNNAPSYVNMGYAPRPLHGDQPPPGHAVVLVPSSVGFQQHNTAVLSGQAFSYNNASLTSVGGYGACLPLPHGVSPSATHGVHFSPGLYSVQLLSYRLPPSMPASPQTTGVPFQLTPLPYPPFNATPNPGSLSVVYGPPSLLSYQN